MLELKFVIYYRAASLPSQASYAVLAEESLTRPGLNTPCTSTTTVFLILLLSDLCEGVHVKKKWCRKNGVRKEAIVLQ